MLGKDKEGREGGDDVGGGDSICLKDMGMKHWRSMTSQDVYLGKVFSDPPIIAYKRKRNIADFLIKAKVPATPNQRPQRKLLGMKKCGKCVICPFILEVV